MYNIEPPPPPQKKVYFFSKRAYNIEYFFDLFGWAKNVNIPQYDTLFYQFLGKISALMPIFCQKTSILQETRCSNDHILSKKRVLSVKKYGALMPLFSFFLKPPAIMPIFRLKNVKIVKTTKYYGPKKSVVCPFFRFFTKK